MPSEILSTFESSAAITVTLASLASSTAGVGRQSTMVNNETTRHNLIHVFGQITTGTSPTTGKTIQIFLLKRDSHSSPNQSTDNAGGSDAAITLITARMLKPIPIDGTSDKAYYFDAVIRDPGPSWGIAVVHDTGVNLNSTGSNHEVRYVGDNPESQ